MDELGFCLQKGKDSSFTPGRITRSLKSWEEGLGSKQVNHLPINLNFYSQYLVIYQNNKCISICIAN